MSKLRLMFQNQWYTIRNNSFWEEKGLDCSAKVRMRGNVRVLKELMPDVLGGQEVNWEMQRYLKFYCSEEKLPYTMIWGNDTPILYRSDKLNLLDSEFLLYPEHVEGFEGSFNNNFTKSFNLGVFQCKEDGQIFILATTHLWFKNGTDPTHRSYQAGSDQVRRIQVKMAIDIIEKYQKKYSGSPIIFGGDFNSLYHAEAIQYALSEREFVHAHDVAVEAASEDQGMNDLNGEHPGNRWLEGGFPAAIDHILVRDIPQNSVLRFERYMTEDYLVLSDHAPVYVDMNF